MPNYDELFKEYCLKQNSEETVTGACAILILGFVDFLKEKAVEQSVQSDGAYCACNPNEAPYKVGSNVCAVCEKPRR